MPRDINYRLDKLEAELEGVIKLRNCLLSEIEDSNNNEILNVENCKPETNLHESDTRVQCEKSQKMENEKPCHVSSCSEVKNYQKSKFVTKNKRNDETFPQKDNKDHKTNSLQSISVSTMSSHGDVIHDTNSITKIKLELQDEKKKRACAEQSLNLLREVVEANKIAIQKISQSKELAIEMVKQLREKYISMRNSRDSALLELESVKSENSVLQTRMNEEINYQKKIIENLTYDTKTHQMQLYEEKERVENDVQVLRERIVQTERQLEHERESFLKELEDKTKAMKEEVESRYELEKKEFENKLKENEIENSKLLQQRNELEKELKDLQLSQKEKMLQKENEFSKMKDKLKENEDLITKEKNELEHLVNELTYIINDYKTRVQDITKICTHQEEVIISQNKTIINKTEMLEKTNKEKIEIEERCRHFEREISKLHQTIDTLQNKQTEKEHTLRKELEEERLEYQQKQLELLKQIEEQERALRNERDNTLVKDKIIEDQLNKIKIMRNDMEEKKRCIENLMKNRNNIEYQLSHERDQYEEVIEELEKVRLKKNKLKSKIVYLEEELKQASNDDVKEADLKKYQELLLRLEKQVHVKQKQWQLRFQELEKQKAHAEKTAQIAILNLMNTAKEFRSRMISFKKIQLMLTSLVKDKDIELYKAKEQIKQLNKMFQSN